MYQQGDNTAKKDQFEEALKRLGLEPNTDAARRVHEAITGQRMTTIDEMVNAGKELGYGK